MISGLYSKCRNPCSISLKCASRSVGSEQIWLEQRLAVNDGCNGKLRVKAGGMEVAVVVSWFPVK